MTDEREPIRQYLDQLRLSLRIPEVGRILVEAEDHLRAATAAGVAAGLKETEAQRAAIARFGPVSVIVYAHQTRHGRVVAILADLAIVAWRSAAYLLIAYSAVACLEQLQPGAKGLTVSDDITWVATGAGGAALLAAFYIVRHLPRRGGRVWSVPLGGFFPLAAAATSGLTAAACLLLLNARVITERAGLAVGVIGFIAFGMMVTYGGRMVRMLRDQSREPGELA